MRKVLIAALAALSLTAVADDDMLRLTGGNVRKPGSGKGSILVLNTQSRVGNEPIREVIDLFNRYLSLPIEVRSGTFEGRPTQAKLKALGATFAIIVREAKDGEDVLTVAPESKWAVVNTALLADDGADADTLTRRVQKEVVRAFGYLCGSANSTYEGTVMGPVGGKADLDGIKLLNYPLDSYQRTTQNLKALGVEPYVELTYASACQRGWAPAPTNEYQKAIWDKIHEIPSKPIKIEFDPKRDKGK